MQLTGSLEDLRHVAVGQGPGDGGRQGAVEQSLAVVRLDRRVPLPARTGPRSAGYRHLTIRLPQKSQRHVRATAD
jgi:hypothetical protein